jgi:hypothetical protein
MMYIFARKFVIKFNFTGKKFVFCMFLYIVLFLQKIINKCFSSAIFSFVWGSVYIVKTKKAVPYPDGSESNLFEMLAILFSVLFLSLLFFSAWEILQLFCCL